MVRFGDGVATGPDLLGAAEAAIKQAIAPLDRRPDLACVFVCGEDPDLVAEAARHAMLRADARTVLGCTASGVIGGSRGVEEPNAVSAWAGVLPDARLEPFRLETMRTDERLMVLGMPEGQDDDVVGVLLADPYSFPVDAFVERSGDVLPGLPLVGGLASGSGGPGTVRLFIDGEVIDSGAVGVVIGGPVIAATLVSQGARPIGPTMVVTKAEDNILYELAGAPALDKLEQIVAELTAEEQALAAGGLLIGVAMDEYADEHEQGDFLVRGVVGADTDANAIAIGDVVEVGRTVRFQVRDASAAEDDLTELLDRFDLPSVEGALLFSCNARGRAMFPTSDHDIEVVRRALTAGGVGGFFAAGEIGPVGGRNHVHGFTASILAFGPASAASAHGE
ncbi:MAG TPA: FIST N-terminal domain-containing protein [Streptosporangiaceae bacterium]|nr:FIST N-terminal domain-containing protein [Streptosporangiaceae bacterium]